MTDIAKITTAVTPLEEVDKINEVIERANQNATAIAGLSDEVKPGMVMPYAGATAPTGWLICDGSAISRTTYSALFAVIGTTYGAGDGSTTFNLPNFSGKIPLYDSSVARGTTTNGNAPNIKGSFGNNASAGKGVINSDASDGCFESQNATKTSFRPDTASMNTCVKMWFAASRSSSVYSDSATGITPAGVYVGGWCIKY